MFLSVSTYGSLFLHMSLTIKTAAIYWQHPRQKILGGML